MCRYMKQGCYGSEDSLNEILNLAVEVEKVMIGKVTNVNPNSRNSDGDGDESRDVSLSYVSANYEEGDEGITGDPRISALFDNTDRISKNWLD